MSNTTKETQNQTSKYDESSLKVLKGLEAVRKRPAMYLGSIDTRAYHHMVWELVDNSIDEHLAGHAQNITVTLYNDGSVSVQDDGRGIPVGIHPTEKISAATVAMTTLHAGGKFDNDSYKVSGGLHGVGASVVNALSTRFEMRISREGGYYEQDFINGGHPVKAIERTKPSKLHGTTIRFWPDMSFFEEVDGFDSNIIRNRLKNSSYLNPGLRIVFVCEPENKTDTYIAKEFSDILDFLSEKADGEKTTSNIETHKDVKTEKGNVEVFIAMRWHDMDESIVRSYANNISTPLGGQHETGFRMSVLRAINTYGTANGIIKSEKHQVTAEDVAEGLVAAIAIRLSEPKFEAQTKERLANTEARGAVQSATYQMLQTFFEENGKQAKEIVNRAILASKGRAAAKRAKDLVTDRKGVLTNTTLPGKLYDCQEKDPAKSEIFIVEGDSAGGCFTGDTKIMLASGTVISFADLVHKQKTDGQNSIFAVDERGEIIEASFINARVTKKAAKLIRISLDNRQSIRCTPDHLFMKSDGTYKKAEDLHLGERLMSYERHPVKSDSELLQIVTSRREISYEIVSLERLEEREDVYDLEVPGYHNFSLASGIFVHNSAKMGRDNKTQAILPLRGKILNIEKSDESKTLKSEQITTLIRALGCGTGKSFDQTKLRYHKIIIMTDADVDGEHIFTLIMTFFHRYIPQLVSGGYIYIAMPPLYRVQTKKESHYIASDKDLESFFENKDRKVWTINRFKGLGEMDPEQLAETTMNLDTRTTGKIIYGPSGPRGSDPTFETLMGDDVVPRRSFIEANAEFANVDI